MAEKNISPAVFTNEIDQSFLPSDVADIGAALTDNDLIYLKVLKKVLIPKGYLTQAKCIQVFNGNSFFKRTT